MADATPRVAVVIPSWNRVAELRACLASVAAQSGVEAETLVVDNGSTDGSLEYLESASVPHVPLPENIGFAAAVDLGIARTSAPLVMVLNADAELEPDALALLARAISADREIGGVQPRILDLPSAGRPDPDDPAAILYSLGQALTGDGRAIELGAGEPQGDRAVPPREVFGVCGAACLLRREMLEDCGGYDERYFAFYEDVDLNVRARILGWRFALEPAAVAWHLGNTAWKAGFERPEAANARLVARNRLATQIKFMPVSRVPRMLAVESASLARAAAGRRLAATAAGKLEALRRSGEFRLDRRRLARDGNPSRARRWLA